MSTTIKNRQTVLFIGDSITDCGRRAAERPLGNGYVNLTRLAQSQFIPIPQGTLPLLRLFTRL